MSRRSVRIWGAVATLVLAGLAWLVCWWVVGRSWQGVRALSPTVVLVDGYLLLAAALLLPWTWRRRGPLAAVGVAIVVVLLGSWLIPAVRQPSPSSEGLRILTWNMQDHPETVGSLVDAVRRWHPALVLLEQPPKDEVAADPALRAELPYRVVTAAQGAPASVALFLATRSATCSRSVATPRTGRDHGR